MTRRIGVVLLVVILMMSSAASSAASRKLGCKGCYTLVQIDRATPPIYPDWVVKVVTPSIKEIQSPRLPEFYDITAVKLLRYGKQKNMNNQGERGQDIYNYLANTDLLGRALTLQDAEAWIKLFEENPQDIKIFHQLAAVDQFPPVLAFRERVTLFFWGTIVVSKKDGLEYVPCLQEQHGQIVLRWSPLTAKTWYWDQPAALF